MIRTILARRGAMTAIARAPTFVAPRSCLSSSAPLASATKQVSKAALIAKIRAQTEGVSMSRCREALEAVGGEDVEAAVRWIAEREVEIGRAKADKLMGRAAKEGLVGLVREERSGGMSLVEVNCETDFVARNTLFRSFVASAVQSLLQSKASSSSSAGAERDSLRLLSDLHAIPVYGSLSSDQTVATLKDALHELVGRIGENVVLRRGAAVQFTQSSDGKTALVAGGYVHSSQHDRNSTDEIANTGVDLGRIGSLVGLQARFSSTSPSSISSNVVALKDMANKLARQVVGMSPRYLDQAHEKQEAQAGTSASEDLPPSEKYLLMQPLIGSNVENQTVAAWLETEGAKLGAELNVQWFVRYELGQ